MHEQYAYVEHGCKYKQQFGNKRKLTAYSKQAGWIPLCHVHKRHLRTWDEPILHDNVLSALLE